MPRRIRIAGFAAALVVAAGGCGGEAGAGGPGGPGGAGGWSGKGGKGGKGGREAEALAVEVTAVEPARIERYYRGAGTLQALRVADLVALQPSVVLELKVEEGEAVTVGQLLVRLDGRGAQLQAARDRLSARNASQELQRLEQLRDVLSREELDKQRYAAESALASAQVSRHQATLTTIAAPFSGTITRRHIDIGNFAGASTPLYTIADLSALDLKLHVPEREASAVRPGAPVRLELQDGGVFEAKVERRAPVVDARTGTVEFTIRATGYPAGAVPGAFVRAALQVDLREAAPSLPRGAIVEVEGKPHVYVVEEGRARRKPVELGLVGDARAEIRGGLPEGVKVVLDAGTGITEGMPVRVRGEAEETGPKEQGSADKPEEAGREGKGRGRRERGAGSKGQGPPGPGAP